MTRLWAFIIKEFHHIYRDKRTLMILIGMPVVQIMLFGFAITNEIRDAKIAIVDKSTDGVTRELKEKILSSDYFVLTQLLNDETEIERVFRDGSTKLVLVFEQNFAQNLEREGSAKIQILSDATDPNTANTLVNYIQAIVADYNQSTNSGNGVLVAMESRMRFNPELKGVYYFVPGVISVLLMLISAMMTSISITREKELGTMEILLASPMKPGQIILAKVIPYLILSLLISLIILGLGKYVFGVPILGSFGLLMGVTLLYILLALSLGILISTVTQTQQAALLISMMGLMMPIILLSGFIFPVENMPLPLQVISNIIPARWFIIAVKAVMLKGSGIELIYKEMLILFGFTLVFIGASIRKFKVRLE